MKRGKNPTLAQKKIMKSHGLDPKEWLVNKKIDDLLVVTHRYSKKTRRLEK